MNKALKLHLSLCALLVSMSAAPASGALQIDCPDNRTMHWSEVDTLTVGVIDFDVSCLPIQYSVGQGSEGLARIDSQTGELTIAPGAFAVCEQQITLIASDDCGAADTCILLVCVQNYGPTATCSLATETYLWGESVSSVVTFSDPDAGSTIPDFRIIEYAGPGNPEINAQGEFYWQTYESPEYLGEFTFHIVVSDGSPACEPCSPRNADTCSFSVTIEPTYRVTIKTVHNVIQGGPANVHITLDNCDSYEINPIAGFDFLIQYDSPALSITGATEGKFFLENEWEYFTYGFGQTDSCNSNCPTRTFRLVAIAEINDAMHHPSGFTNSAPGSDVLVTLHFQVSNNRNLECHYSPVRFYWADCGDNAFASPDGSLISSRYVYENSTDCFGDDGASSVDNPNAAFPTLLGVPSACPTEPLRRIDFRNGGVEIICAGIIDARGDMNLNGISNEVSDAELLADYLVHGPEVFSINIDGQTAASEVNGDGIPLTLADLQYMIRIITGDQIPRSELQHYRDTAIVTASHDTLDLTVDEEIGAALLIYDFPFTVQLSDIPEGMDIKWNRSADETRVLVYNIGTNAIGDGRLIGLPGVPRSVYLVGYDGSIFASEIHNPPPTTPKTFYVNQNYPNPFNAGTVIEVGTAYAGELRISIYNTLGRLVDVIATRADAGTMSFQWVPRDNPSGVYYYQAKLKAFTDNGKETLTASGKMTLLK